MKKFKKTIHTILAISFIFCMVIVGYNYFKDEFCVFHKITQSSVNKKYFWPNERMLKTKYILQNPSKYDSFLFGSSKANKMSLRNVKNGKWFNSCLAMNSLDETLLLLKIYEKNNVKIKNILLQMSDENFREQPVDYYEYFDKNMIYARFPDTLSQKLYFYGWYLLVLPDFSKNKRDIYADECKKNVLIDGSCTFPPSETHIVRPDFKGNFKSFPNLEESEPYNDYWLKPLKQIVDFCTEKNINLTVIITPETYDLYKAYDQNEVKKARKQLSKLTSYYDFSGKNTITQNPYCFYDYSHLNEYTSNLIIDRVFNQNPNNPPSIKDFGNFVKKIN